MATMGLIIPCKKTTKCLIYTTHGNEKSKQAGNHLFLEMDAERKDSIKNNYFFSLILSYKKTLGIPEVTFEK